MTSDSLQEKAGDPESNRLNNIQIKKQSFKKLLTRLKTIFKKTRASKSIEQQNINLSDGIMEGLNPQSQEIIKNIIKSSNEVVSDVMIPRADIISIKSDITFDELTQIILENENTRMPVYKEYTDNVIGFVHIKDIIPMLVGKKEFSIASIMRDILMISPSMKIIDLIAKMRKSGVHIALVLDEHGGVDGLITIEDLLEEIVGEIHDEHDNDDEQLIINLRNNLWEASGRIEIEELEEKIGIPLIEHDDYDFHTLAGLILSIVGHIPVKGEIIKHSSGLEFKILDVDQRKVKKVLIKKKLKN